ncbi:MAG: DUF5685 family protein [Firmicutes bacterium]|nr:DUF5685 family protein [Bacillota bacterium]
MFGYTKPHSRRNPAGGEITSQQSNRAFSSLTIRGSCCYKAHYCGLCFALSRQYGLIWRALANFDSTLLVLLMSAQWPHVPAFAKVLCPLGSYRKYYVIDDDQLFMKIGSAFTVAMVDLKSQDALTDGARWAKPAQFLGRRTFAVAGKILADNSFDMSSLSCIQERQEELESMATEDPPSISFDELAAPTGLGLGRVLEYTAELSGLSHNAEPLRRIGNAAGKIIYAADCLEDLESDLSKGRFNALTTCSMVARGTLSLTSRASEGLQYLIDRCQAEMAYALEDLELVRYRPIIESILLTSLPLRASGFLESRTAPISNHSKVADIG